MAVLERRLGLAVKVEDGAPRAQYPARAPSAAGLEVLPAELPPRLAEFLVKPVRNTRGEVVGELVPAA